MNNQTLANLERSEPRRAVFVTHSLGTGGSERVTVSLANYFTERGWKVFVIPLTNVADSYVLENDVSVDSGVPQRGGRLLRGICKLLHVHKSINKFDPDVVISLGAGFGYLWLSTLFRPQKMITSVRNDPAFLLEGNLGRSLSYKLALSRSSKIVFQTQDAMAYFGTLIQQKSVVISNPLHENLKHNSITPSYRRKEIVSFGRLLPQKRLDLLLKAFELFHREHPEYRLSIFGRGPEHDNLLREIERLELSAHVSLEDFQQDIHTRIADAAMYVSTSDVEGVSNAMLEAMAIGLPSVCTDCPPGGARETIEKFQTGLLAQVGDAESIAARMLEIADSPELAESMTENGLLLMNELSRESIGDAWIQLASSVATQR